MLNFRRRGHGQPLVLLHGFLGGSAYWESAIDAWSDDFDVIAPDLPGFAGSSGQQTCRTISEFGNAIVHFAASLGIHQFHLLGHSMGGMIAQQIALDHQESIGKLVLYGTSCRGALPGRFETLETTAARITEEGVSRSSRRIAATWFVDSDRAPGHEVCAAATMGTTLEAAVAALEAIDAWDVSQSLVSLRRPTLVIAGDRDRSCPPTEAFQLWRSIESADLCIVPHSAHAAHLEAPEAFFPPVSRHLGTAEGQLQARRS